LSYDVASFTQENDVTRRMMNKRFFLGLNFVFGLLCTPEPKNLKKIQNVFQKPSFSSPEWT